MNKKSIATILMVIAGNIGVMETATAMIARPQSVIPPFEYYRPNDPCFDHIKGYTCNPPQASGEAPQRSQLVESEKKKNSPGKRKKKQGENDSPW